MGPLPYWILFSILVTLLVVFVSCLIFNVVVDNCLVDVELADKNQAEETEEHSRLNKYHFDKHDVEDLTRIQGDFKTALPNLTITNEVENNHVDRLLKKNERRRSSLPSIDEEGDFKHHMEDFNSISSIHSISEEHVQKNIKAKISQSVDNLEFCDPSVIDVLKEIHHIEDQAMKIDKSLDYLIGDISNFKYYEINETLLRLMISLCDMACETSDLRKKKSEALEFIEECQKKLKKKARDIL